jgi:N-formylglutamate amidohydrolase
MKQLNQNLSEIFDIEPIHEEPKSELVVEEVETGSDLDSDLKLARSNIRELLQKSDGAIDNLLKVAEESEHPRAYEVAATLIKTMADLNKDLIDIQKKRKELTGVSPKENNSISVDKAVFVGSTTDLIKMIKNNKE